MILINLVTRNTIFNYNKYHLFDVTKKIYSLYAQPYTNNKQVQEIREKHRVHERDTGTPEYQIAILTVRIFYMTSHIKKNPKDFSSTRGLIAMVSARKKLLKYLRKENKDRFLKICLDLKIRIQKDQQ